MEFLRPHRVIDNSLLIALFAFQGLPEGMPRINDIGIYCFCNVLLYYYICIMFVKQNTGHQVKGVGFMGVPKSPKILPL